MIESFALAVEARTGHLPQGDGEVAEAHDGRGHKERPEGGVFRAARRA
jgi:hypothetical protein